MVEAISVFFGILGGFIGGMVCVRAWRRTSSALIRTSAVISTFALTSLGSALPREQWVRDWFFPPSKIELAVRKNSKDLFTHPRYIEAKSTNDRDIQRFILETGKLGLRRSSPSDLIAWNDLRIKLADVSSPICSGLWTGRGLSDKFVATALNQLGENDVNDWVALSMRAAVSELNQDFYTEPPEDAVISGLELISQNLTPEDLPRFRRTIAQGVNAPDEDACWTMKLLLRWNHVLPQKKREQFLRALAAN